MRARAWLVGMLVAACLTAAAEASPRDELEQTRQDLEASKERQEKLAEEQKAIEADLENIQRRLVTSVASMQKMETELAAAEGKLAIFNEQLRQKNTALSAQRKKLEALVQAALHMSRMPPEAMVMLPGDKEAMKAAPALRMMSDSIRAEMEGLALQSAELDRLQQKAADHRSLLAKKKTEIQDQKQVLQKKLAERETLRRKLGARQEEEAKKSAELAKKAEDLQSLFTSIRQREKAPEPGRAARGKGKSFSDAKGTLRLPLAGKLTQRFGAAPKNGQTGKGIVLTASADDAQVVAPFEGEVVFTGPFLNYGKLVILRHSDDFHTLLAGLETIDAGVGDFLLEGEPIGAMGSSAEGRRLYVELRKNNQPVNPEPWMKELTQKKR